MKSHTKKPYDAKNTATAVNMTYVDVLVAGMFTHAFSYRVPKGQSVKTGQLVEIPVRGKTHIGIVWEEKKHIDFDIQKIKNIEQITDITLPPALIKLITFIAEYYIAPRGMALKLCLPSGVWHKAAPKLRYMAATQAFPNANKDGYSTQKDLQQALGISTYKFKKARDNKTIWTTEEKPSFWRLNPNALATLNNTQQDAVSQIKIELSQQKPKPCLLEGVTGSGKTEVYLHLIAEQIKNGGQALLLMPEIALAEGFITRLSKIFEGDAAIWHSDLSARERAQIWQGVTTGDIQFVIGARSALFLPFQTLKIIVVDEEHDTTYKQEDSIPYNARDMAITRAAYEGAAIILVSATPSLETIRNVNEGKYTRYELPTRFGKAVLPKIQRIDLRKEPLQRGCYISAPLKLALKSCLANNQQAIIFINRRGFAMQCLCTSCGQAIACPHCTVMMSIHGQNNTASQHLKCHHCGTTAALPDTCPSCQSQGTLINFGPGVERIAKEISTQFPDARVKVWSSDSVATRSALLTTLKSIRDHDVDIIVGTQILAKGHDYPGIALVGIVDGGGIYNADFRATERTFQLLMQVSGRAGRRETQGHVLIQTHCPEHPVLEWVIQGNKSAFYENEIKSREQARLPPFTRMAMISIAGQDEIQAKHQATQWMNKLDQHQHIDILGPLEAPVFKSSGLYRFNLVFIAPRQINLSKYLSTQIEKFKLPSRFVLRVDIDPMSGI